MFGPLQRIAEAPGKLNKITLAAKYFWWMTMAGAGITQMKALANGQNPHDMTLMTDDGKLNLDFWGRAIINGGSAGILGDLAMNNINYSNSSYHRPGPVQNYLARLHGLTIDNVIDAGQTQLYDRGLLDEPGDDIEIGKDAFKLLDATFPNFWHTKLIFQRAISDELFEQVDPAGYAKSIRHRQEHEAGDWWAPGGEPEAPRFETAIGG